MANFEGRALSVKYIYVANIRIPGAVFFRVELLEGGLGRWAQCRFVWCTLGAGPKGRACCCGWKNKRKAFVAAQSLQCRGRRQLLH